MILRFLFTVVIIYILYRVIKGIVRPAKTKSETLLKTGSNAIQGGDLVQDPCCLIYIPEKDAYKGSIKGETCYFCSKSCFEKYQILKKKES
jgi:YHS domain-containing protein